MMPNASPDKKTSFASDSVLVRGRAAFLDPFNAKLMKIGEVTSTFVTSEKFDELAGRWHAVLVGPRGSGKTTLLKMLSLDGLRTWTGPKADAYRRDIGYTGIYVPSDIAWSEMVRALSKDALDVRCAGLVTEAAFVTNVLLSTALTMQERVGDVQNEDTGKNYGHVHFDAGNLEQLVRDLAFQWKLEPHALSLRSVAQALSNRLLDIKQKVRLLQDEGNITVQRLAEVMPYIGLPLIDSVAIGVATFDSLAQEKSGMWCLLLDEFEVAPIELQDLVLKSLRATATQNVLIKVALAPCGPQTLIRAHEDQLPSVGNDLRQVELWYPDKGDASAFCEHVFQARTANSEWLSGKSAGDVFGQSAYAVVDESGEQVTPAGHSRSTVWRGEFANLSKQDPSFSAYVEHKRIDIENLDTSSTAPNGNTIRKIAPLVAFRNAYQGKSINQKRGVKPYTTAYAGWGALAAMSEGNPRWLIGMLSDIWAHTSSQALPISRVVQKGQAAATAQAYAEMLKAVATEQFDKIITSRPVFPLLKDIGDYFHNRIVIDEFMEDPPMSFVVDQHVSNDIENALRIALNHGAIVCYEGADRIGGFQSLRGKRFRLTYLLAPVFRLPIRKSKPVGLSTILECSARKGSGSKKSGGSMHSQEAFQW